MSPLTSMARAARKEPEYWVRVNHMRTDGRIFEVGHNPDPELVDPVVVAAYGDHGEATTEAVRLTWEAKMRAALVALAEAESDDAVCVRLRVIASNPSNKGSTQ